VKSRIVPVGRYALVWLAVVAVIAVLWPGGGAGAAPACDKFASTLGLNTNPGTELLPYRTVQKLVNSLSADQTGCLRAGTYPGATVSRGGAEGAPVTLQSYPGERAKIIGRVVIEPGADHVTLSSLDLVGTNVEGLASPMIQANDVTVADSDITNLHTADCVFVGTSDHFVENVKITRNRIHDCGLIPRTNRHVGISVWNAGGTEIIRNVIDHNADRGIQLYPNAWRTNVAYNTIDANGEGVLIAGSPTLSSSYNVVQRNLITNSTSRDNVEVYWPPDAPIGTGNVVRGNCVSGGPRDDGSDGGIQPRVLGTTVSGNLVVDDPGYVDELARDYDLRPDSACEPVSTGLSWRPFRDGSPWNVPANQKGHRTPDNPYASQFTSYSNELEISGIPNGGGSGTAFAKPIFFAQPGDPEYVWTNVNGWGKGDIRYQGEPIPMPDGAHEASGSDGHLTIVTADRHYAYDMWRADVATRSAAVIVRFDLTGSGVPSDQNQSTSARGSGAPVIPSTIRADEALAGIHHAIGITVPSVSHDYIFPATHSDGNLGSDAIKYGMLFVLRPDYPVPADASVGERNVIQALKTYGAYVVDQGASMELDADSTQPELWAETGLRASTLDIGPQDFRLIVPDS
jgi:parallel beta-helix repeat protein